MRSPGGDHVHGTKCGLGAGGNSGIEERLESSCGSEVAAVTRLCSCTADRFSNWCWCWDGVFGGAVAIGLLLTGAYRQKYHHRRQTRCQGPLPAEYANETGLVDIEIVPAVVVGDIGTPDQHGSLDLAMRMGLPCPISRSLIVHPGFLYRNVTMHLLRAFQIRGRSPKRRENKTMIGDFSAVRISKSTESVVEVVDGMQNVLYRLSSSSAESCASLCGMQSRGTSSSVWL